MLGHLVEYWVCHQMHCSGTGMLSILHDGRFALDIPKDLWAGVSDSVFIVKGHGVHISQELHPYEKMDYNSSFIFALVESKASLI